MKNALILILIIFSFPLFAQNLNTMCGNGDFESGTIDPTEWSGYWAHSYQFSNGAAATPPWIPGIISGASAIPGTIFNCTGVTGNCSGGQAEHVVTDHHTIIPAGNDPLFGGLLSTVAPQPSVNNYSLRLGNTCVGCGFEKIEKTFLVDPASPNLSFWFAVVLIDGAHNNDNPAFQVRIFDQTTSTDISGLVNLGNGSNTIIANAADNFFTQHPDNPNLLFRRWDCVQVDLSRQASHIVTVEFINRDCGVCGHYAYTYLDNLCLGCSGSASGSIELDTIKSDTCGLPGEICIDYTLPDNGNNATGDCQIDLTIYQNGVPLVVFNSPVLTSGDQYCFPFNSVNLAALNTGFGGFDFTATGHFSITDAFGNTQVLPDKTVGTAPDGVDLGLNNDYELLCGGQANCDSLVVTVTKLPGGECCYSVDLQNHQTVPIAYVEASLLSPDWAFASGFTAGLPFSWWPGAPGPNSLPISITGVTGAGSIPSGDFSDALTYCFEPVVPGTTQPQVVVFTWYTFGPAGQGFVPICRDTVVEECQPETDEPCVIYNGQINCNPENPYEYFVNFTVTNQSGFTATHVSLDNLSDPVQFGFSACAASDHLASIAIPLVPPLPNGATSGLLCVKITSLYPVLTPTTITLTLGLYNPIECCHNEMPATIILRPCCEPCEDIQVEKSPISIAGGGQCCYSLDIVNACAYQFFHKVETEILTPGIQFGYHAIGGPNAADWNMGGSSATSLIWAMNGTNYIPSGTTMDLIQFCLDDIDQASEVPQLIAIKWFTKDQFGQDSLACTDTLALQCDPVIDYHCLEVTNQVLECSPEDSVYCYTFTVENTSSIPFGATNLDLFEVSGAALDFTGGGGTFPLPPLNPGDTIRLTVCFSTTPFPLPAGSELIFQYRLRYLMGDTCCYESALDTIPVPDCFSDSICPPKCCCYPSNIAIPTGLSPNNDGFNDVFFIQGTERCNNVTLTVYNRWGNVVYKKDLYDNSWAGTNQQGDDLPQGTYFILLTLHDSSASMSGFVDLRRE